jgi:hypothetical protein
MPGFVPNSQTDIANLALAEVGQNPIADIDDTESVAAQLCARNFWASVAKVAREHSWNCLQRRQTLTQLALPESSSFGTSIGWSCGQPTSWPPYWLANTAYAGGTLVTYSEAVYYCTQAYTSSNNFINDLTAGYWVQMYQPATGAFMGPAGALGYEWDFGFVVPEDYILLTELNGNLVWGGYGTSQRGVGDLYEIFVYQTANPDESKSNVRALFCNTPYANVKYTALIQDTTLFDPHFVDAVAVFLASKIATPLRADDGRMAAVLRQRYATDALPAALVKDAGERKFYRYDPTRESNFLRSRFRGTNG